MMIVKLIRFHSFFLSDTVSIMKDNTPPSSPNQSLQELGEEIDIGDIEEVGNEKLIFSHRDLGLSTFNVDLNSFLHVQKDIWYGVFLSYDI